MDMNRKNILILSFTLLVVMLGYGMIQPIIPFLITKLGASGSDLGVLSAVYAAMQLVCAPFWGTLSDRIGRKPVLLIGVLGYAIAMFIFGLATRFWMLFVARTFSGVLSSAAMPTAMAYISDNLPKEKRGGAMGELGAAVGLGVVLGPLLGGLLSSDSLSLPFFVGSGLALFSLLLVFVFLPESHPVLMKSASHQMGGAIPLNEMNLSNEFESTKSGATHPPENFWQRETLQKILLSPAGVLMLLIFIIAFGMTNFQNIIGLYVVEKFAFDTRQVGAIWMVLGGVMIVSQGALTGLLTKALGEVTVIRLGLLAGALGFGALLLANGFISFLAVTGVFILAVALIGPALNSYLSAFGGEHQGALMGLNTAFASLGRVVGPLWAGFAFDMNIAYPFISGAVVLLIGLGFSFLVKAKQNPLISPQDTASPAS
jgi:DHA1 family multidrug resistance protein-like MFS transporter